MMSDVIAGDEDIEEEIEAEVDKVYAEITAGLVPVPRQALPTPQVAETPDSTLANRVSALHS